MPLFICPTIASTAWCRLALMGLPSIVFHLSACKCWKRLKSNVETSSSGSGSTVVQPPQHLPHVLTELLGPGGASR